MESAHKIIFDDFFFFKFDKKYNTDLHWSMIMNFKSWFCSDSKLIYEKKIIEQMSTLISTFHFRLHNYTAHLSNVLKLSRSFETQLWNLLCWKYKINEFYFGTNTKSTNLRIHELVIFNQTTKIDTHEEKYFHSNWNIVESVVKYHNPLSSISTHKDFKLQ